MIGNIVYIAVLGLLVWGGSLISSPPISQEPDEPVEILLAPVVQAVEGYTYSDDFYCGADGSTVPSHIRDETMQRLNLYDSHEAAMEDLGFMFMLPTSQLAGGVFQICGETDGSFDEARAFIYTYSGLMYKAFPHDYAVDYEKWVGWNQDEWDDGVMCADRPPEVVEVRGRKSWSIEPHFQNRCIRFASNEQTPGKLYFWEADVEYWVSGTIGDRAFTVEQLASIVESFE